ncbi:hypothetical protein K504DRAFT_461965 [Pleomassaria siparia CBS 279.74]|uniref:Uncharacterized protein n=1 Tax=Pleomassaria siparia CBS 279.74 TaxID=1314801 RepID=A0A6G1KLE0_9PLEO|nr:hypothetical protein K504DRAFT_461965 [Pleomassaria siparia CBS 279.74]
MNGTADSGIVGMERNTTDSREVCTDIDGPTSASDAANAISGTGVIFGGGLRRTMAGILATGVVKRISMSSRDFGTERLRAAVWRRGPGEGGGYRQGRGLVIRRFPFEGSDDFLHTILEETSAIDSIGCGSEGPGWYKEMQKGAIVVLGVVVLYRWAPPAKPTAFVALVSP